jgi:hypothetical protein
LTSFPGRGAASSETEPITTWEKIGASAGLWAVLWLVAGYAITRTTLANPAAPDQDYVRALLAERAKWEWVTMVRLVGGILMLWFMGSLAGRLRVAEGEPGRLAAAAFGLGVVWAGVWLLSAFFNSASILLASDYGDPAGSRIAGILAREMPAVLTPSVVLTLLLASSFVLLRSGGFPKSYTYVTAGLAPMLLLLAVVDWYGRGGLSPVMIGLTFAWTASTSALLISRSGQRPARSAR